MTIRALIVDDEPLAREAVWIRLNAVDDIVVVGEASSGTEAIRAIEDKRPDVVFLDVQLGDLDGFEVLEQLDERSLPMIVFVTAHDAFAVRAFEVHALDFLLKPFEERRFQSMLARVRTRVRERTGGGERSYLESRQRDAGEALGRGFASRLEATIGSRRFLVPVGEVRFIQGAGDYARLHLAGRTFLVSIPLRDLERMLDPACFIRVHRSYLVSRAAVRSISTSNHHEYSLVLDTGQTVPLSRSYKGALESLRRG